MSWLSSFFHPERGYEKGQGELNKYFTQSQGYQQPIFNQGQEAYSQLSSALQNLLNPQKMQDEWAKGYQESESAKGLEGVAKEHGLDAASSMGLLGSTPAIQAIQAGTTGIVANDRQNYLNDLMQKYLAGTGLGESIYGAGTNAANNLSNNASNMGTNSANLAYGKENAKGDLFGKLLGGGVGLLGSALGGPLGGVLGAGLSQGMGWSPKGSYTPWSTGGA